MEPLTHKQRQVLDYIEERLARQESPSQREVADRFGVTQNAAYQTIQQLRKKGYLQSGRGHRGLTLSATYRRTQRGRSGVPIIGRVAAGQPSAAEEHIEGYFDLQQFLGMGKRTFLLRVAGDSMVDEGILEGDLVVVRPDEEVPSGSIAVVQLDHEATVKRVFFESRRIALQPANREKGYPTRYVTPGDGEFRIVGKVVGCIRTAVR